jgi:hypothetical protein
MIVIRTQPGTSPRSLRTGNRRQSRRKHRCATAAAPLIRWVGSRDDGADLDQPRIEGEHDRHRQHEEDHRDHVPDTCRRLRGSPSPGWRVRVRELLLKAPGDLVPRCLGDVDVELRGVDRVADVGRDDCLNQLAGCAGCRCPMRSGTPPGQQHNPRPVGDPVSSGSVDQFLPPKSPVGQKDACAPNAARSCAACWCGWE